MEHPYNPDTPVSVLVAAADSAVEHAQAVRKMHARKSPRISKQRQTDIRLALGRLRNAMRPVRRRLVQMSARAKPVVGTDADALRAASAGIQRERRKLWKMNKPITRRN